MRVWLPPKEKVDAVSLRLVENVFCVIHRNWGRPFPRQGTLRSLCRHDPTVDLDGCLAGLVRTLRGVRRAESKMKVAHPLFGAVLVGDQPESIPYHRYARTAGVHGNSALSGRLLESGQKDSRLVELEQVSAVEQNGLRLDDEVHRSRWWPNSTYATSCCITLFTRCINGRACNQTTPFPN